MLKWFRLGLIVVAVLLFSWQLYSYFSIDYEALTKSVRQPFERNLIDFDEDTFALLQEMDEGKRIKKLRARDFGRRQLFLPN